MAARTKPAKKQCPKCGHIDDGHGKPEIVVNRPWHIRSRTHLRRYVASLGDEIHEWLLALFVDANLNLLSVETVDRGSASAVEINLARILSRGYALGAKGFILVHNHPSGIPQPSVSDIRATRHIDWVARGFGIPLLDHCIVAGDDLVAIDCFAEADAGTPRVRAMRPRRGNR